LPRDSNGSIQHIHTDDLCNLPKTSGDAHRMFPVASPSAFRRAGLVPTPVAYSLDYGP
jgi:hypothetical protein